jgi:hypothetical protein
MQAIASSPPPISSANTRAPPANFQWALPLRVHVGLSVCSSPNRFGYTLASPSAPVQTRHHFRASNLPEHCRFGYTLAYPSAPVQTRHHFRASNLPANGRCETLIFPVTEKNNILDIGHYPLAHRAIRSFGSQLTFRRKTSFSSLGFNKPSRTPP